MTERVYVGWEEGDDIAVALPPVPGEPEYDPMGAADPDLLLSRAEAKQLLDGLRAMLDPVDPSAVPIEPLTPIRGAEHLPAFWAGLVARLEHGARAYGDASFARPLPATIDELRQELLDLAGWGFVGWVRLAGVQAAAGRVDQNGVSDRAVVDYAELGDRDIKPENAEAPSTLAWPGGPVAGVTVRPMPRDAAIAGVFQRLAQLFQDDSPGAGAWRPAVSTAFRDLAALYEPPLQPPPPNAIAVPA